MSIKIPRLETVDDYIAFAQKVNPKMEHLTIEKLRSYPGCENYTDDQAASTIQTLEQFALILFEIAYQKEDTCIENQQVVYLNQDKQPDAIPIDINKTKTVAA
jgi:hypothetical protein